MTSFISKLLFTFSFIVFCATTSFALDRKDIPYYSLYNPELVMQWVYQNIDYIKDGSNTMVDIRGSYGILIDNPHLNIDYILSVEQGNCVEMSVLMKYIMDKDCFEGSQLIMTDGSTGCHMVLYYDGKYYDCTSNTVYYKLPKSWGTKYYISY